MCIELVTVIEYGGKTAQKVLVSESDDVVLVTSKEEWERSRREFRSPVVVGFRRTDITVGDVQEKA